jgi:hypothetical protein
MNANSAALGFKLVSSLVRSRVASLQRNSKRNETRLPARFSSYLFTFFSVLPVTLSSRRGIIYCSISTWTSTYVTYDDTRSCNKLIIMPGIMPLQPQRRRLEVRASARSLSSSDHPDRNFVNWNHRCSTAQHLNLSAGDGDRRFGLIHGNLRRQI